jgi:arylsulfatase A-like enzyme
MPMKVINKFIILRKDVLNRHVFVLLFLLAFTFSFGSVYYKKKTSIIENESSGVLNDSIDLIDLITKEIIYEAPKSGKVFFSWKSEQFSNSKVLNWNKTTKLSNSKLYTPMEGVDGLFKVSIRMPIDSQIYYGFRITKDNLGTYQDLWDWRINEILTFTDETPIKSVANYIEPNNDINKSLLVQKGWLIFFVLLLLLFIIHLVIIYCFRGFKSVSVVSKTLILGLSAFLLHVIARSEIIKLHPKAIMINPNNLIKLFKASLNDMFYIMLITLFFMILLLLIHKKKTLKNWLYNFFVIIIFASTLIAFTNITAVIFLGRPFNYEWFYYSDFLGSDYATNLIQENLSIKVVFDFILLGLSVLILSKILQYVYIISSRYTYTKPIAIISFIIILCVLLVKSAKIDGLTDRGKTDNAILAMTSSLISGNLNGSFFTMSLSEDEKTFIPNDSTYYGSDKDEFEDNNIKNVLYIVLESLGANYMDDYKGKFNITPNLSVYAKESLVFDNVYAHIPSTNKSMVSILGSIYPNVSYKSLTQEKPDFNHQTISSVLKNRGYKTSFFSSANFDWQSTDEFLTYRGFDIIEDFSSISCIQQFKQDSYKEGDAIDDSCLSERFEKWLDKSKSNNFFSILWTIQGHYPYFFSHIEEDFGVNNIELNRYLNIIKHDDKLVGEIIQILKDNNLYESTLIVVTGDHGEAFGQHGFYGHASALYEENIKVPLYFINPEIFNGEIRNDIASIKDLASTTLSILDIDIPDKWQGRDLTTTKNNEAFFFTPYSDYLFGYRKDNRKFIFNETAKSIEVFDLLNDPFEKVNIIYQIPKAELNHAKRRIASWVQYQDKFVNENLLN